VSRVPTDNLNRRMKTALPLNPFSYLLAVALVLAFVPSEAVLEASAGNDPCCPPEDTCCPENDADDSESPDGRDCCPSDCSVCLLTCCVASASLLVAPVTLEGNGETDSTPPLHHRELSSADSQGIYHPPRQ
jgi:hypothetical protein